MSAAPVVNEATPFFRLARWVLRTGFGLAQGMRVEGLQWIPASGPCLIAANHVSWLDPPALGCCVPQRQLHFMAKKELFTRPVLGPLIRALGSFPVDRGQADRASLRAALQLLQAGRTVCVFPEGTRSDGGPMKPWYTGLALLAQQANVDIIPAAVLNSRWLLEERRRGKRKPMWIRFGPPVSTEGVEGRGRERMEQIQDRCRARVEELLAGMREENF